MVPRAQTRFASRAPSIPDWWGASRAPPRCGPPPRSGRTARLVGPAAKSGGGGQSGVRPRRSPRDFERVPLRRRARRPFAPREVEPIGRPANADGRKSALPMDARARKPARETPTTGSIAYLYPGLPACSPQSRARRALGRVTASPRPPLPSEPRGASRVRALPASATNAARRGPRARRAVRRDVPCVPRPSTQPEPVPFESPASSLRADGVRRVAFWRLRRARLTRAQATFLKVPKNVPPDGVGKIRPSFGGPRCRRISNLLRIPRANQNRDLRKIFLAGKIVHGAFSVTQMRKGNSENR